MGTRDRVLYVASAVAYAALGIASTRGWLAVSDAAELAGVVTAFGVAYHIPNARAAAALHDQKDSADTT